VNSIGLSCVTVFKAEKKKHISSDQYSRKSIGFCLTENGNRYPLYLIDDSGNKRIIGGNKQCEYKPEDKTNGFERVMAKIECLL